MPLRGDALKRIVIVVTRCSKVINGRDRTERERELRARNGSVRSPERVRHASK